MSDLRSRLKEALVAELNKEFVCRCAVGFKDRGSIDPRCDALHGSSVTDFADDLVDVTLEQLVPTPSSPDYEAAAKAMHDSSVTDEDVEFGEDYPTWEETDTLIKDWWRQEAKAIVDAALVGKVVIDAES